MTISGDAMFFPMLAMFLWTFLVMLLNMRVRVRSILRRDLSGRYFELFQGGTPPETVVKVGNHFHNLMEMPPLFYVVCILIMVMGTSDGLFVILAWIYVGLRVAHSLVHLTCNFVPLRFSFFFAGTIVLLAMWLRLAWVI